MSPGRTIVDSEDEEQDPQPCPPSSLPVAQSHIVDLSNSSPGAPPAPDASARSSTGSTALSKGKIPLLVWDIISLLIDLVEALNLSIHNAHFALMEPTPDAKASTI